VPSHTVSLEQIDHRWNTIRQNDECGLSLDAESVSAILSRFSDADLVSQKIMESLTQLAERRLGDLLYKSDDVGQGDLVTCEGLECFLIPAVEGAVPFSDFLSSFQKRDDFSASFLDDVNDLLSTWETKGFLGAPYAKLSDIKKCMTPAAKVKYGKGSFSTTEGAAFACRVLVHIFSLTFTRSDETLYQELIGSHLDRVKMRGILKQAIEFLVSAFQKGEDIANPIGSASFVSQSSTGGVCGSGWSWTDIQGLPPMLFFTSSAVDAFAELELYLIRPGKSGLLDPAAMDFYRDCEEVLLNLSRCVDMARRWVSEDVLTFITQGYGWYEEQGVEVPRPDELQAYKNDLRTAGPWEDERDTNPLVLYNNLYALLILLWTFADWDDSGVERDEPTSSKIERALVQLVAIYRKISSVKEVLDRIEHIFRLPGDHVFTEKGKADDGLLYFDSSFGTMLARQLVLFGVYGVGDRNMLDPLIREMYVDLMLERNREDEDYPYLWPAQSVKIFSTQRAIQALTFYRAYFAGLERSGGGQSASTSPQTREGLAKLFGAVSGYLASQSKDRNEESPDKKVDSVWDPIKQPEFQAYHRYELKKVWPNLADDAQIYFQSEIAQLGDEIIEVYNEHPKSRAELHALLIQCSDLAEHPINAQNELDHERYNSVKDDLNAVGIRA
jgi:hypothetical protein